MVAVWSTHWLLPIRNWLPGVPFYGRQPDAADVADIKAPMLIQNAELDERINAGWPAYEEALKCQRQDL